MKPMKPKKTSCGITFYPVPEFKDTDVSLGADRDCFFNRRNLPEIPSEYEDMAESLFFNGGPLPKLSSKVDERKARRALRAWLCSFSPAHESKIATAGYALWLWTNDEVLGD